MATAAATAGYAFFPTGGLIDTRQERGDAALIDALGRLLVVGERQGSSANEHQMVVTRLTRAPLASDALFADGFE